MPSGDDRYVEDQKQVHAVLAGDLADSDHSGDRYEVLNPREEDAARAFKSALVGLVLGPLQLYTAWLILMVLLADEPLRPRYYWYAVSATAVLVPQLLLVTALLYFVYFQ